jgi:CRISPR/Cas system-associated protein Csm6
MYEKPGMDPIGEFLRTWHAEKEARVAEQRVRQTGSREEADEAGKALRKARAVSNRASEQIRQELKNLIYSLAAPEKARGGYCGEDLLQEAFCTLLAMPVDELRNAWGFLKVASRNQVLDWVREGKRMEAENEWDSLPGPSLPVPGGGGGDDIEAVEEALDRPKMRSAVDAMLARAHDAIKKAHSRYRLADRAREAFKLRVVEAKRSESEKQQQLQKIADSAAYADVSKEKRKQQVSTDVVRYGEMLTGVADSLGSEDRRMLKWLLEFRSEELGRSLARRVQDYAVSELFEALEMGELPGVSTDGVVESWQVLEQLLDRVGVGRKNKVVGSAGVLGTLVLGALRLAARTSETELPRLSNTTANLLNDNLTAYMLPDVAAWAALELVPQKQYLPTWEERCGGLPPLLCAPDDVLYQVNQVLGHFADAGHASSTIGAWAVANRPLLRELKPFLDQHLTARLAILRREVSQAPLRCRLWPLAAVARNTGEDELIPSLSVALFEQTGHESFVPALAVYRDRAPELTDAWETDLASDVMRHLAHGHLVAEDVAAARAMVADRPGVWAVAHRGILHGPAFVQPVMTVDSVDGADPLQRLPESLIMEPGGRPSLALTASQMSGALPAGQDALPPVPTTDPSVVEDLEARTLARMPLVLAGAEMRVHASRKGLWTQLTPAEEGRPDESAVLDTGAASPSSTSELPLLEIRGGKTRVLGKGVRLGVLRNALARRGLHLDRSHTARAYIVTVGESILRAVFGWNPGGECTRRLSEAALSAGIATGGELVQRLTPREKEDALEEAWLADLQTVCGSGQETGALSLRDLLIEWKRKPSVELIRLARRFGGELATLLSLPVFPPLRPVDGDLFLLVPTATASGMLAALLVRRFLGCLFGKSAAARILPASSFTQEPDLSLDTAMLHEQPVLAMVDVLDQAIKTVLKDDKADPVIVFSGGTKFTAAAAVDSAFLHGVECVYKADSGPPAVFFWKDLARQHRFQQAAAKRQSAAFGVPGAAEEAYARAFDDKRGAVVVNVGISLLSRFRRERRTERTYVPEAAELWQWVGTSTGRWQDLCAEWTGIATWFEEKGTPLREKDTAVVLVHTRSVEGELCASVIRRKLEEEGFRVVGAAGEGTSLHRVADFSDVRFHGSALPARDVLDHLVYPLRACLAPLVGWKEPVAVLPSGGQKLTSAMLHMLARGMALPVYFASEPRPGQPAHLWEVGPTLDIPANLTPVACDADSYGQELPEPADS